MFLGVHHSATWVYADGRLIRFGARQANGRPLREAFNRWSIGFVEQRLTREGVRLLRSEIVSAGGFGEPSRLPAVIPSSTGQSSRYARVTSSSTSGGRAILSVSRRGLQIWSRGCLRARGSSGRSRRTCPPGSRSAPVIVSDNPGGHAQADAPGSHRGSAPGGSPERAPRQGLECERSRAGLFRSDNQRSPLARQGSRWRGACKEGPSELQIQRPRPEPTGLDRLQPVPPARRDQLLAVRMSSRALLGEGSGFACSPGRRQAR